MRRVLVYSLLLLAAAMGYAQGLGPGRSSVLAIAPPPPTSVITFAPSAGTYTGAQTVTMATTLSGGTIFYTTDGTTPTIASTRYSAPITVSATETVKAIAAAIAYEVDDQNQNTNTSVGSPPAWKPWCFLSSCNPGGSGTPQATVQTFGITSPEHASDGTAMKTSVTSDASTFQTNSLLTLKANAGGCTNVKCTQFLHDFWWYMDAGTCANLSESEHDQFWFDALDTNPTLFPNGIRWMYGAQLNRAGGNKWQFGGNSNVPWTDSGVTWTPSCGAWHHIQLVTSLVAAEIISLPCVDGSGDHWPYLYYNQLNLDGAINNLTFKICANSDPADWASSGFQHQQDIHNKNAQVIEYYSADMFFAAGNSTSTVAGLFTIN